MCHATECGFDGFTVPIRGFTKPVIVQIVPRRYRGRLWSVDIRRLYLLGKPVLVEFSNPGSPESRLRRSRRRRSARRRCPLDGVVRRIRGISYWGSIKNISGCSRRMADHVTVVRVVVHLGLPVVASRLLSVPVQRSNYYAIPHVAVTGAYGWYSSATTRPSP